MGNDFCTPALAPLWVPPLTPKSAVVALPKLYSSVANAP